MTYQAIPCLSGQRRHSLHVGCTHSPEFSSAKVGDPPSSDTEARVDVRRDQDEKILDMGGRLRQPDRQALNEAMMQRPTMRQFWGLVAALAGLTLAVLGVIVGALSYLAGG